MPISMTNPTGRNTPAHRVDIGRVSLFFSYDTLVGARYLGHWALRLENHWGPTTGRHINEMGISGYTKVVDTYLQSQVLYALHDQMKGELARSFAPDHVISRED